MKKPINELLTEDLTKVKILDVREIDEFVASHIEGACNVPLSSLTETYAGLDQDVTYHVMCKAGKRSAEAYRLLHAQGFDVVDLEGGIIDWQGPTVTGE